MRKSVRLEALEPHGKACRSHAREILRPERHLCGIRDGAPRERRSGRRKIPNQGNGLSRGGRNRLVRTLTASTSLAADLRQSGLRKFSLRQSGDGGVAADGSAKNAIAVDWPQICHRAERFGREGCGTASAGEDDLPALLHVRDSPAALGGFGALAQVKTRDRVKIVVD